MATKPIVKQEPELKTYEVWLEGYINTYGAETASYVSTYKAKDFADAVLKASTDLNYPDQVNMEDLTYCNRKFFDNEADARSTYG